MQNYILAFVTACKNHLSLNAWDLAADCRHENRDGKGSGWSQVQPNLYLINNYVRVVNEQSMAPDSYHF